MKQVNKLAFYYDFLIITNEINLPLCFINIGLNDWQYYATKKRVIPIIKLSTAQKEAKPI